MNLLIISRQYFPVLGGVPVVARLLAHGFIELGTTVRLVTATLMARREDDAFEVYRNPSLVILLKLFRWADKIVMIGPSVRSGWPVFFSRKPCLISHQAGTPAGKLQRILMKKAANIACSNYLAKKIGGNTIGVANPFNRSNFNINTSISKDRDFAFVGRLVPDKGIDILLHAVQSLLKKGIKCLTSIIGAGVEEHKMKQLAVTLGVDHMVFFTGPLYDKQLTTMLQRHRIGIVPSKWQEPFGIVALEFIACGIPVIASRVGGLPEAVGSCGLFFTNSNHSELAIKMEQLLLDKNLQYRLLSRAEKHLDKASPKNVAKIYLSILSGSSISPQHSANG